MEKIAVFIVYNHRYDKNIPILDKIYDGRFSYVYHLVPFYDGNKENVFAVYDSSYYFQNYIAQAYQHIKDKDFTHFLVVADDMIINPSINENNIFEKMGISRSDCYISRLSILQERKNFWKWTIEALKYKVKQPGVEVKNELPAKEEAEKRFGYHNLPIGKIPFKRILTRDFRMFYNRIIRKLPFSLTLDYPLVGGYSDIFFLTNKEMPDFCKYCGAFAATKLFVEIAIPTALVLTADTIKLDKDIKLKRGDIWSDDIEKIKIKYDQNLDKLIKEYPEETLFIHPIKLSQWKSVLK